MFWNLDSPNEPRMLLWDIWCLLRSVIYQCCFFLYDIAVLFNFFKKYLMFATELSFLLIEEKSIVYLELDFCRSKLVFVTYHSICSICLSSHWLIVNTVRKAFVEAAPLEMARLLCCWSRSNKVFLISADEVDFQGFLLLLFEIVEQHINFVH
jgi:hypothetical protein